MSTTWDSNETPDPFRLTPMGAVRTILRGLPLALLVFGCLAILLLVRLIERPIYGQQNDHTGSRFRVGGFPLRLQLLAEQLDDTAIVAMAEIAAALPRG